MKFLMLIGLPGSGKSAYATRRARDDFRLNKNVKYISSDAIRGELYGNEADQSNPAKVFDTMYKRTVAALKDGCDVIYDATNISRKRRRDLLSRLPSSTEKFACVIWARYETCIERDSHRERTVGQAVIKRMLLAFQPPYYDEGWKRIEFKMNDKPYTMSELEGWLSVRNDNPHHSGTVGDHTRRVVREVTKRTSGREFDFNVCSSPTMAIAAYLHDIGKGFVKSFADCRGNETEIAHFYGHHNVGSYFSIGCEECCGMATKARATVAWLVNVHMDPFFDSRYYRNLSDDLRGVVDFLHQCDLAGA